ncbi:MAG: hypothetical protein A2Z21_07090 [Candidatus Fraserbacteria bacterium RBG_16_55_9]|uniref:TRASH domain-containing protein n=1 Tax=Fraserbacteria sp. (strain RBG_16_55_9) TaxID=1817864 RepID=A0A1F5UTS0_FRAXR|nr:MAG: hypothetical protein A2Z21_07090 [Candidatus Fraserbacteria bacterium RBG_16_55_9]
MAKMTRKAVYWTCAFCDKAVKESEVLRVVLDGQTYYTCSPRCCERLAELQSRYAPIAPAGTGAR